MEIVKLVLEGTNYRVLAEKLTPAQAEEVWVSPAEQAWFFAFGIGNRPVTGHFLAGPVAWTYFDEKINSYRDRPMGDVDLCVAYMAYNVLIGRDIDSLPVAAEIGDTSGWPGRGKVLQRKVHEEWDHEDIWRQKLDAARERELARVAALLAA